MKSSAPASLFRGAFAPLLCLFGVLLVGCNIPIMNSKPLPPLAEAAPGKAAEPGPVVEGVPYFLPSSVIGVTLESVKDDKGKHKEMTITTASRLVPDRSKGFLLSAKNNGVISKTHLYKFQDGMLTLVSTEDDGKLAEIFGSLATLATDIYTFGAVGGRAQSKRFDDGQKPTNEEILAAYAQITPGPHDYAFAKGEAGVVPLEGTEGQLYLSNKVTPLTGASEGGVKAAEAGEAPYGGIYVRMPKAVKATVSVQMDLRAHFDKRVRNKTTQLKAARESLVKQEAADGKRKVKQAELEQAKKDLEGQIVALKKQEEDLTLARNREATDSQPWRDKNAELIRATGRRIELEATLAANQEKLDAAGEAIEEGAAEVKKTKALIVELAGDPAKAAELKQAEAELAQLKAEAPPDKQKIAAAAKRVAELAGGSASIRQNELWRDEIDPAAPVYYTVTSHDAVVLVPDETTLVQLPLTRGAFGITKYNLALQSGVLTEFKVEKPSQTLEFLKIPVNIAGKLVELPAKILSVKIDIAKKQKDLLTAEDELAVLKDKIADAKAGPGDHALEVKELTQEKEILALQKEIAELRQAIDKATKKEP